MALRVTRHTGLLALIVASAPLVAQGVNANLPGIVTNTQGATLAGATITIRHNETGYTRTVTSGENGRFMAAALPVGLYTVTVAKDGFQTASNIKLVLYLGDAPALRVKLAPVSAVTVEVIAASVAPVESERTTTAVAMVPDSLQNLPVKGRSFSDLALLTPQVVVDTNRGNLAIAGQRGVNTSINVDGGDYNEPFMGGAMGGGEGKTPFTVSMEAVREFQVITDGASAEFGRMGGGYVNAITKGGTNEMTGSLFYYWRPSGIIPTDHRTGKPVADKKTSQFGFSAGGPIIKDKLFYFVVYDGQRSQTPVPIVAGGVSNPVLWNTTNPADRVLMSKVFDYKSKNDADTLFARLDYIPNTNHNLQLRINTTKMKSDAYTADMSSGFYNTYENSIDDQVKTFSLVGQWNWTIGSSWLNEFRANYVTDDMPRATRATGAQVTITNVAIYGSNPYPRDYTTKRYEVSETLTYVTPTLQIKGGLNWDRTKVAETFAGRYQGIYTFDTMNAFRAGTWSRFDQLLSLTPGHTAWDDGKFEASEMEMAAFVQADWRPSATLKVGLGLRFDRQEHPSFGIANYDASNYTTYTASLPLSKKVPTDNSFSPRLSMTWTPDFDKGNTVVRFSTGVYVSRTPAVFLYQVSTMNGVATASYRIYPSANLLPYGDGSVPGSTAFDPASPVGLSTIPSSGSGAPNIITFDSDFRNPQTLRANLGVERAFQSGWVLGFSSSVAHSKYLERITDLNLNTDTSVYRPNAYGRLVYPTARPNTRFGNMLLYKSDAEGKYIAHTLSAKYQKVDSPFEAQLFYTWSKDLDNDSNERDYSSWGTQDVNRLDDDYSYSNRDRRHVVTGYFAWSDGDFTGIKVGTNLRYMSGRPYSLTNPKDLNNDSASNDRLLGTYRNEFRDCSLLMVDLKLTRDWAFFNRLKLGVSFEVFNLFNHVARYDKLKWSGSDASPVVTRDRNLALSLPREYQLGVRFTW